MNHDNSGKFAQPSLMIQHSIKIFAFYLPSQQSLDSHFGSHIFFTAAPSIIFYSWVVLGQILVIFIIAYCNYMPVIVCLFTISSSIKSFYCIMLMLFLFVYAKFVHKFFNSNACRLQPLTQLKRLVSDGHLAEHSAG